MSFLARLQEILGSPRQDRKWAMDVLNGNLLKTIAEHMMKLLLFGTYHPQEAEKWKKDLRRQLRDLVPDVSKKSNRLTKNPEDKRLVFSDLHLKASNIMRRLNEMTAFSYREVLRNPKYKKLKVSEPSNIESGVFSNLGFSLKDTTGLLGKGFELSFNDEVIVNTTSESTEE